MRILLTIMIPNPFTRPITAWITVLVILLHGITVWAMVNIDSPKPLNANNRPKAIQLELITLDSESDEAPSTITASDQIPSERLPSSPKPVETTKTSKPLPKSMAETESTLEPEPMLEPEPVSKLMPAPEPIAPLTAKVEVNQVTSTKDTALPAAQSNTEPSLPSPTSVQGLTITESRQVARASNQTDKTEDDLSDMIRSVTEQYNRDQARQRQSAIRQANRKKDEQAKWQEQAANVAVSNMLALAAAQAQAQANNQNADDDTVEKESVFVAEYGSWREGNEPNTSIPALAWRSIDRELGDVFIVMLELHIDTEGHITEVQLLESSGSPIIDAIATTQVRAGQVTPIKQNEKAIEAIVPMSLVYERP